MLQVFEIVLLLSLVGMLAETGFSGWLVAWFLHCSCCTADQGFYNVL
jgi:hypothetical protein